MPQTPSLPREIKRREKLEKELREVKAALKARADEVASKEEDIAAGEERLRLAESKLHDTKVRAEVLRVSVSESAVSSAARSRHVGGGLEVSNLDVSSSSVGQAGRHNPL